MPITNYTYDKTGPLTETDTNVKITCTVNDTVYIFDIAFTVSYTLLSINFLNTLRER